MQTPRPSYPKVPVGGHHQLSPQQIVRLRADGNYTFIHHTDGRRLLVALTLKVIEERLRAHGFVRITRGDLINRSFIEKVWKDGNVQLADGTRICASRRRRGVLGLAKGRSGPPGSEKHGWEDHQSPTDTSAARARP